MVQQQQYMLNQPVHLVNSGYPHHQSTIVYDETIGFQSISVRMVRRAICLLDVSADH